MLTRKGIRLLLILFTAATMLVTAGCTPQYLLNTSVSPEGTGIVSPASGTYDKGTEVTLTAKPAPGYRFDHWSGDATGNDISITLTMDSDKSFTANFVLQYLLNTSVSPEGTGIVSPASGTYDKGTEVTLTAKPAPGYCFDHWSGDATGHDTSITLTIDSDKSVTAHFTPSLGAVVSGDIWEVKVVSVEKVKTLPRYSYRYKKTEPPWSTKEAYSFLIVEVQYRNISPGMQEYNSQSITVTDSRGGVYIAEGFEVSSGQYTMGTFDAVIGPGASQTEEYVFVVRDYAEGFYFNFIDTPEIYLGQ